MLDWMTSRELFQHQPFCDSMSPWYRDMLQHLKCNFMLNSHRISKNISVLKHVTKLQPRKNNEITYAVLEESVFSYCFYVSLLFVSDNKLLYFQLFFLCPSIPTVTLHESCYVCIVNFYLVRKFATPTINSKTPLCISF